MSTDAAGFAARYGPLNCSHHGQDALELSETAKARDQYDPKPALLWINAPSYLPLKMINGVGTSQPSWTT